MTDKLYVANKGKDIAFGQLLNQLSAVRDLPDPLAVARAISDHMNINSLDRELDVERWAERNPAKGGPFIVVAQDGSGDFTTMGDAINANPDGATLYVKSGTYAESSSVLTYTSGARFTFLAYDAVLYQAPRFTTEVGVLHIEGMDVTIPNGGSASIIDELRVVFASFGNSSSNLVITHTIFALFGVVGLVASIGTYDDIGDPVVIGLIQSSHSTIQWGFWPSEVQAAGIFTFSVCDFFTGSNQYVIRNGSFSETEIDADLNVRSTAFNTMLGVNLPGFTLSIDSDNGSLTGVADAVVLSATSSNWYGVVSTPSLTDSGTNNFVNHFPIGAGTVGPTELADTAVTPASYGSGTSIPSFTVDQDGRLTTAANNNPTGTNQDFAISAAGKGLKIKEGTNAKLGIATLVAGTVVVSTTAVTASSRIFLTVQSLGTVAVATPIAVTARTAGTSFTITSSALTDTSVVAWMIVEPA